MLLKFCIFVVFFFSRRTGKLNPHEEKGNVIREHSV